MHTQGKDPPKAQANPSAMTLGKSYPSNPEGDDGTFRTKTPVKPKRIDKELWQLGVLSPLAKYFSSYRPEAKPTSIGMTRPLQYLDKHNYLAKVRRRHRRCSKNRHNRHRNSCRLTKSLRQHRIAPAKIERVYKRMGAQACTRKPPSARRDG